MRVIDATDLERYLDQSAEAAYVRTGGEWVEDVLEQFRNGVATSGATLPWPVMDGRMRLRPGEVSIWAGVNGHGKSIATSQVVLHLLSQGEKCCIASFEMHPKRTMYRMTRQALGSQNPTEERIRRFNAWVDSDLLWLYDQQGTVKADRVITLGRYCAQVLKIQHVIIDSLMKCGIGVEDYNAQKAFVDRLCALARDTGLHVHLVAHSRKGESEYREIGKFDIKGASEITDQVDNVITLWRNKPKEAAAESGDHSRSGEPDAILRVDKQRHGEWEGKLGLWFLGKSMQYATRDAPPREYVK